MRVRRRGRTALVCVPAAVGLLLAGSAPALADGAAHGADLQVAQTLGDRELTVVIRYAEPVPGPLRVDVISHAGSPPGTLVLRAAATDSPGGESTASVTLNARPGAYPATLSVDRAGPWQLTVDDGTRVARIPFVVATPVVPPWEWAAYGGFTAAGALLLVALVVATRARRRWPGLLTGGAMVAALAVGGTGAVLSGQAPLPQQPGRYLDPTADNVGMPYPERRLSTVDYSRPPVNLAVRVAGAGRQTDLRLDLTDSATGRPVDDLLVHDAALIHLIVIGPAGDLWHLHPVRLGAGRYQARWTPSADGEYAVAAEVSRRGGGVQLLRTTLRIGTGAEPVAAPPAGQGTRMISGVPVELATSGLSAGTPSTITARFGTTPTLQLWLGMLGHLIVVGPLPEGEPVGTAAGSAPVWAHAHAMAPIPGQADETVAGYGPEVGFTYTFPVPGRYRVWVQAERDYTVLTVPATVDVRAEEVR
jgi:hypothetical protein